MSNADSFDFCFIGLKAYDYLANRTPPRYIGGIERDMVSLARVLTKRWRVAFITLDHQGDPSFVTEEGIHVFPAFDPQEGVPKVRLLHPRLTSINKLIRRIQPSVLFQMGSGEETVLAWCASQLQTRKVSFAFLIANDGDCDDKISMISSSIERVLYKFCVKRAALVLAQTERQVELAANHLQVSSRPLRIPSIDLGGRDTLKNFDTRRSLTWIGRIAKEKRPHLLAEIADLCPDLTFNVVGQSNTPTEYERTVVASLAERCNINLLGRRGTEEIAQLLKESLGLVSTSSVEGFPRVFLEAWSCAAPVFSTFDPDTVIERNSLGLAYTDPIELAKYINNLSETEWEALSDRCRRFYDDNYSVQATERIISKTIEQDILGDKTRMYDAP